MPRPSPSTSASVNHHPLAGSSSAFFLRSTWDPRGGLSTLSPAFPWACPWWQLPLHPSYSCASLGHLHSDTVPWGLNARAGGSSWNPGPALLTPGDLEQFIQLLGAPGSSCLQAKGMETCLNPSGHSIHCSHLYMVLPAPQSQAHACSVTAGRPVPGIRVLVE